MAPAGQLLAAAELCVVVCLHVCKNGASGSQDSSSSGSGAAAAGPCWLVPPQVYLYSPGFWPVEEKEEEEREEEEEFRSAF